MRNFKKTLLVCWFGVFVTSIGLSQIAPVLPFYLRELGLTKYDDIAFYSGLAWGITPLLVSIFTPVWGFLGAKFGYKSMLLRASLGMAILTLMLAFARDVFDVVTIRALTGIVAGFNSTAVIFIAMKAPKKFAAYALGTLSTASVSGSLIGPLFGGLVAEFIGLRFLFAIVAFFLFCSFITMCFVSDIKNNKVNKIEKESKKTNFSMVMVLCILTFVINFAVFGIAPVLSIYVEEIHKNGELIVFYAGLVVAASGISNIFFAAKIGKIADKIGYEKIITISLLFSAFVFYLQIFAETVLMLVVLRLLFGVALGGLAPCVNAMLKKISDKSKLSLVLSINQSFFALGGFASGFGNGYLVALFNVKTTFLIIALLFFSSAVLFFISSRILKDKY